MLHFNFLLYFLLWRSHHVTAEGRSKLIWQPNTSIVINLSFFMKSALCYLSSIILVHIYMQLFNMLFDLYIVKLIIDKLNHRSLMRNVRLSCTFEEEHVNISWTGLYCPKLTNFFSSKDEKAINMKYTCCFVCEVCIKNTSMPFLIT